VASEAKEESCLIGVRLSSEQKERGRDFTSALFFLVAVNRGEFLGPLVPGGNGRGLIVAVEPLVDLFP
jgi:hypothetical protein